jgi:predicted TPR repeat methyltransferase
MRLRLKPSVLLSPVDDGYVAFDTLTRQTHHLNPSAALIVELCDGTRSLQELRDTILPLVGDDRWSEFNSWIDQALRDDLLDRDGSSPVGPAPESPDSLSSLARELRDEGRVLEAFVCQQRAVELAPDASDSWYELGELAHIVGRRADARSAYEEYAARNPDDAEIAHILTALRDEPPPPRAPVQYIEQLYSRFASFYDSNMTEDLEYRAPALIGEAIARADHRRDLRVLDLGCGTGLSGQVLQPRAKHLAGVDLSPEMIAQAERRGLYDELHVAEITEWLSRPSNGRAPDCYDLVVACDALIYFGDLSQVLAPAASRLAPGGILGFTVEAGNDRPFRLSDSGRFTHHADHVTAATREAGLSVVSLEEAVLRNEYGEPVTGLVIVLRRD